MFTTAMSCPPSPVTGNSVWLCTQISLTIYVCRPALTVGSTCTFVSAAHSSAAGQVLRPHHEDSGKETGPETVSSLVSLPTPAACCIATSVCSPSLVWRWRVLPPVSCPASGPSIKRTICKVCCTPLLPGVTATVRQRCEKHMHMCVCVCVCACMHVCMHMHTHAAWQWTNLLSRLTFPLWLITSTRTVALVLLRKGSVPFVTISGESSS